MSLVTRGPQSIGLAILIAIAAGHSSAIAAFQRAGARPSPALRIVVIEGEGAINIIQQKSAVAPIVEVRDRNDQPVAGAVVTFAVRGGRATFDGARSLTLTTNVAGRAAAAGLTPTASGAVQISASAAFQGQTAVATIVQTNVATAAQAAAVSAGGAGGTGGAGTAGGAAGGAGGGGLSTTTLVAIGGAAAGGTLVAVKAAGGPTHYSGTFSGPSTADQLNAAGAVLCTVTVMHTGTVTLDITIAGDGTVSGTGGVNQTRTVSARVGANCGAPQFQVGYSEPDECCSPSARVQGTAGSMSFNGSHPGGASTTWNYSFSGAQNGAEISGTFTLNVTSPTAPPIVVAFPVTLR